MSDRVIKHLSEFVKEERLTVLKSRLQERTRYITVCLEDIYQSQNASAVLRTCDAFGVQNVHIIENLNKYQVNPMVARGSAKWIDMVKYNNADNPTLDAIAALKKDGYRIVATSPHEVGDTALEDFDLTKGKAAIVFGTELTGISQTVVEHADEFLRIPMHGFVESLNISVSAAIVLHYLTLELRKSSISWQLSAEEQEALLLKWLKLSVRESEKIIQHYYHELT